MSYYVWEASVIDHESGKWIDVIGIHYIEDDDDPATVAAQVEANARERIKTDGHSGMRNFFISEVYDDYEEDD